MEKRVEVDQRTKELHELAVVLEGRGVVEELGQREDELNLYQQQV